MKTSPKTHRFMANISTPAQKSAIQAGVFTNSSHNKTQTFSENKLIFFQNENRSDLIVEACEKQASKLLEWNQLKEKVGSGKISYQTFREICIHMLNNPLKWEKGAHSLLLKGIAREKIEDKIICLPDGSQKSFILMLISDIDEEIENRVWIKPAHKIARKYFSADSAVMTNEKIEKYLKKRIKKFHILDTNQAKISQSIEYKIFDTISEKREQANWKPEKPPKKYLSETVFTKYLAILQKMVELHDKNIANPSEKYEMKIEKYEKLATQFEENFEKHVKPIMDKTGQRYSEIKLHSGRTGIDLLYAKNLKTKKGKTVKIKGIEFYEDYASQTMGYGGNMIVVYDEVGVTQKANIRDFAHLLKQWEAYEDINNLDELNRKLVDILEGSELKEGQKFEAEIVKPDTPKIEFENIVFEIVKIKENEIILDKEIELDGKKRAEFGLGQFSKLIFKKGFQFKKFSFGEREKLRENNHWIKEEFKTQKLYPVGESKTFSPPAGIGRRGPGTPPGGPIPPGTPPGGPIPPGTPPGGPIPPGTPPGGPIPPGTPPGTPAIPPGGPIPPPEPPSSEEYETPESTEALPAEKAEKYGGMIEEKKGYFGRLWAKTEFISIERLVDAGKIGLEYVKRFLERKGKGAMARIFKHLPFFGNEFQRIEQQVESEEVNQFKTALENNEPYTIREILHSKKSTQDQLKAAISVLCAKGEMIWNDVEFWKTINKFVKDNNKRIKIPVDGDPFRMISEKDKRTGYELLEGAIDSIWGNGNFTNWETENKSSYNSKKESYFQKGNALEEREGGHTQQLSNLLGKHKMGEYVNPHEFEGLISHAIKAGKAGFSDKVYYLVQGLGCVVNGRTILPFERLAHIQADHLGVFPAMEYFTAKIRRPGQPPKITSRFKKADYTEWAKQFDEGNTKNTIPTTRVKDFIWNRILVSDITERRTNRVLRNPENIDHDDMPYYVPLCDESVVKDALKPQAGSKKGISADGIGAAYAGYSQYLKRLGKLEGADPRKIVQTLKAYCTFDGIATSRLERGQDYARLSSDRIRKYPILGIGVPPHEFRREIERLVSRIHQEYSRLLSADEYTLILNHLFREPSFKGKPRTPAHQDELNKTEEATETFKDFMDRISEEDGGTRLQRIIQESNLKGF